MRTQSSATKLDSGSVRNDSLPTPIKETMKRISIPLMSHARSVHRISMENVIFDGPLLL